MDLFLIIAFVLLAVFAVILGSIRQSENRRRRITAFKAQFGTTPPQKGASLRERELLRAKARKEISAIFERGASLREQIRETSDVDNVRLLSRMEAGLDEDANKVFALAKHFGLAGKKESLLDFITPPEK